MVVILDVQDCIKEAEKQLSNKENYRKLNYYFTAANNETIYKVISRFPKENLVSKNISERLKTENLKGDVHFYLIVRKGVPAHHTPTPLLKRPFLDPAYPLF